MGRPHLNAAPTSGRAASFELPRLPERRTVFADSGNTRSAGTNHYQRAGRKPARHCERPTRRIPEGEFRKESRLRLIR